MLLVHGFVCKPLAGHFAKKHAGHLRCGSTALVYERKGIRSGHAFDVLYQSERVCPCRNEDTR
eukprot:6150342-Pleurochrysis_carterae.AAC.1